MRKNIVFALLMIVCSITHAYWQQGAASVWRGLLNAQQTPVASELEPAPAKTPDAAVADNAPVLVLIIDDIGHDGKAGQAVLDLPGKLTVAMLPYTPYAKRLARKAPQAGKEVMLHAPMANTRGAPLGRGGLTPDMEEQQLRTTLVEAIEQIPNVRGVNNHMGSKLTTLAQPMNWVMDELKHRNLFFVDSRTNHLTVASRVAREHGVPNLSRDVFLDNKRDHAHIDKSFQNLLAKAKKRGMAVGIGHPYPETTDYLKDALLDAQKQGFVLLTVSEALAR